MIQTNSSRGKTSHWLLAAGCALALDLANAALPTGDEVLSRVGPPQEQLAELDQGKAISWKLPENSDKELAYSIAIYVPAPLDKVVATIKKGDFAGVDPTITAQGVIANPVTADSFKRFTLGADEAEELLKAEAGGKFNLSTEEIASLAALKDSLQSADKKAITQAVSQRYREILLQRYQAYRQNGLVGIAPYARDGGQADPATELRTAAEKGAPILKTYSPEIYQAWLNYPQSVPADVAERFSWQNRTVEDRPTITLTHRLIQTSEAGALVLVRQFYVGHSYNASQLVAGCLPYRDGAIVFYGMRSSTDQVAGVGSGLKHSIGRDRMKAEMVKQLQRLRTILMK